MKRKLRLILLAWITAGITAATAQNTKPAIRGVVYDETGEVLPGATVKTADGKKGCTTNMDGEFLLEVVPGTMLSVRYIGYKPQNLKGTGGVMKIYMQADTKQIAQVVVDGYQQTDIRKVTGSVGMLSEKDLKDQPLANVDQLMQGKLAGVNVTTVSGRPGESAKVRIRGISSITGNSEPLWVVDGVPIQKDIPAMGSTYVRSGDFSTIYANGVAGINPQDIESITVLKDAAAAAIYGSQAQAGVIVITTKKGKQGKPRVNYSGQVTVQSQPTRDDNLMNSSQKLAYEQGIWDEFSAQGYANGGYYPRIGLVGQVRSGYKQFAGMTTEEQDRYLAERAAQSTDWFDELFRNSVSTGHHVSLSGGSETSTYYVSAGVNTNNGIVKRTSSDLYDFTTKLSGRPSEKVTYNFDMHYSYLKSHGSSYGFDIFRYAYFANPYEKPYNEDGTYAADNTYFTLAPANGSTSLRMPANGFNVMREINETDNQATSGTVNMRGDITWRVTDDLRLYGLASYTHSSDISENMVGQDTYTAWMDRPFDSNYLLSDRIYGNWTHAQTTNQAWLLRAQANYSHLWGGRHRVSAVAGTEVRKNMARSAFQKQYGYDPVTGNHNTPTLALRPGQTTLSEADMMLYKNILNACNGQSKTDNAFASFYGAADYSYDNRYVANATVRSDGSNNFGSKEQFNLTWSTGLAWNIDEEKWMQSQKRWLSRATLRLSTGVTGGVNKSVYPVLIMNYSTQYRDSETEALRLGSITAAPNAHLRWERTHDWNGSLDMGFLDDRYTLKLSFYRRKGTDMVTPVRVVSTTGFTSLSYNTSEQLNQGLEIALGATLLRYKHLTWRLTGNIAYNQNILTKYVSPTGSILGDIYVGYPQGKLFTGITTGIDPATGLYAYQLRSDAQVTSDADLRDMDNYIFYVGTSNAPWTGGLSTSVTYKQLTLSAAGSFQLKGIVKNTISPQANYGQLSGSVTNTLPTTLNDVYTAHLNVPQAAADRWRPDNPDARYPRLIDAYGTALNLTTQSPTSSTITDCVYYEQCSFLKLNSLTLTYSLPSRLLRRGPVSSAGISFTANNLCYWTGYSGLNPESPGAVYPVARSYTLGVNIGF